MDPTPKDLAGQPEVAVALPEELVPVAADDDVACVWRNEAGGLTFRLTGAAGVRYAKWAPAGSGLDLLAEAERMRWASAFAPVPRVLEADPAGRFLVTEGLHGESAVSARWRADPVVAARAIGVGLHRLHDALPVTACPFDWSVGQRIREARAGGRAVPSELEDAPEVDRLVVAHGDACAPNTLLDETGAFLAVVDLDALGVADQWADLAVATMSLAWNFESEADLEAELLAAYGVEPDPVRIRYYRALWLAT